WWAISAKIPKCATRRRGARWRISPSPPPSSGTIATANARNEPNGTTSSSGASRPRPAASISPRAGRFTSRAASVPAPMTTRAATSATSLKSSPSAFNFSAAGAAPVCRSIWSRLPPRRWAARAAARRSTTIFLSRTVPRLSVLSADPSERPRERDKLEMDRQPLQDLDVDAALRAILAGTATEIGAEFFKALVKNLAAALGTHGAWVTEYFPESRRLKALAFWMGGQWLDGWEMIVDGTPCEQVIEQRCLIHIPDNLVKIYWDDPDVQAVGAASYMGMPLLDLDGKVLGHLAVLDQRPMPAEPRAQALFQIFAERAAAELRRLRAEAQVRERERKLGRLVGSAMDAIIELDEHLNVTQMNPAAEKIFGCAAGALTG